MKKLLLTLLLFSIFNFQFSIPAHSACSPPSDYSSCPEQNPEYNLRVRGYDPISGNQILIPFNHPLDPNAPQLSTLLEGNARPGITSLYQIYEWDWINNRPAGFIQRPADVPPDFATLVGFATQSGQGILVPNSGYNIGQGYQAIVLYASPTSITLKYTLNDNVASGYTLHLQNFRVDPGLLALYNQATTDGRNELPALFGKEKIGEALGNEILVSIRDTGSFMDPRWLSDWWQSLDPATALALTLKLIALKGTSIAQKYGACQAEQPFSGGPETKGESFIYQGNCTTSAQGAVDAIIRTLKLDFPNNQNIAQELEDPLDRLKPAQYTPTISERTALGRITFDVCEEGTTNWYVVEKEVEFKTPAWLEKMTTESKELASWLVPAGGQGTVMGERTNNFLVQVPQVNIRNLSCQASNWQVRCGINIDATPGTGHVWVTANGTFLGINNTGYGLSYSYNASVSPGANSFTVNVNAINHDRQPKPEDNASCTIQFDAGGNGSCSAGGGAPAPTPTPRICRRYTPSGDDVPPEAVCVGGNCQIRGITVLEQIQQTVSGVLSSVCRGKTFVITPKIRTPFVQAADIFLREQTLSIFKVLSADAEDAFTFEHALENAQHQFSASPPSTNSGETEIYGQRGVKDSYDWVQDALTPAGY